MVFTRSVSFVPGSVDLSTIEKIVPGGTVMPLSLISLATLAMLVRQLISYVLVSAYCCTRTFVWSLIERAWQWSGPFDGLCDRTLRRTTLLVYSAGRVDRASWETAVVG